MVEEVKFDALKYYSQDKAQTAIVKLAQDRELGVMFGKDKFGKRPDVLQFKRDVFELAKQGATSFHFSEEHWNDPLLLKSGMTRKELDQNRKGFDVVLDIDTKDFESAKITSFLIIEAMKFYGVKYISCKFSGGSGFHIGISMKALPKIVKSKETRLLFPECPKIVALFLKNVIEEQLKDKLNSETPFEIVDVDTVLISSRHMFRGAYSFNEKSGLISVPIDAEDVLNFKRDMAKPENVKFDLEFLDDSKFMEEEAKYLVVSAFDWYEKLEQRKETQEEITKGVKRDYSDYEDLKIKIPEELFPPCIKTISQGMASDGRKRAVFILINFLKNSGYSHEEVQDYIKDWNKRNYEPLKDGYVNSQLMWHKRQKKTPPPANCANKDYYESLGVCKPDNWCRFIKNPVNYGVRRIRVMEQNKRKPRKKAVKKSPKGQPR